MTFLFKYKPTIKRALSKQKKLQMENNSSGSQHITVIFNSNNFQIDNAEYQQHH